MTGTVSAAECARFEMLEDGRFLKPVDRNQFGLTERELEVIDGILRCESNRQIAERLSLSPHTVTNHLTSIFAKLRVRTRVQLAVFVIKQRLVAAPAPRRQM
jgi:two-component system response regulator DegU